MDDLYPVYYQIKNNIKKRILAKEFKIGEKLPSEAEMAKKFNVSRLTIRQAVGQLNQEHILESKRGKGTFVTTDKDLVDGMLKKFRFSMNDMYYQQEKFKIDSLQIANVKVLPSIRDSLDLSPDEKEVIQIERVRSFEGKPIMTTKNYAPIRFKNVLNRTNLKKKLILTILEEKLGIMIERIRQTVSASYADQELTSYLGIPIGSPILIVNRINYAKEGKPIFLGLSYFPGDIFEYEETFKIILRDEQMKFSKNERN
jgi:GntR family transcriptional regulator